MGVPGAAGWEVAPETLNESVPLTDTEGVAAVEAFFEGAYFCASV